MGDLGRRSKGPVEKFLPRENISSEPFSSGANCDAAGERNKCSVLQCLGCWVVMLHLSECPHFTDARLIPLCRDLFIGVFARGCRKAGGVVLDPDIASTIEILPTVYALQNCFLSE